jgi:anti-sigma B factor antagonist
MDISITQFGDGATRVVLVGKLDILGAEKVGLPLSTVAGAGGNVVVDMRGVDFLASIGIRQLLIAATTIERRSGKLVLLDPTPLVTEVLLTTGVDDILPIVRSDDEARAAFAGAASGAA